MIGWIENWNDFQMMQEIFNLDWNLNQLIDKKKKKNLHCFLKKLLKGIKNWALLLKLNLQFFYFFYLRNMVFFPINLLLNINLDLFYQRWLWTNENVKKLILGKKKKILKKISAWLHRQNNFIEIRLNLIWQWKTSQWDELSW